MGYQLLLSSSARLPKANTLPLYESAISKIRWESFGENDRTVTVPVAAEEKLCGDAEATKRHLLPSLTTNKVLLYHNFLGSTVHPTSSLFHASILNQDISNL